jgi:alkylation response protein AidB-like acyl-CoA dehydrogenase
LQKFLYEVWFSLHFTKDRKRRRVGERSSLKKLRKQTFGFFLGGIRFMADTTAVHEETLCTLPGDAVRQIMWRYADRFDLQMLVQAARGVARGPVARAVAAGARNSHDWTHEKSALLKAFDESGVTAAFMDPEIGGCVSGPKNLALCLIGFELAWVDAGAATCALANNLALGPINERGTPEQRLRYMGGAVPPQPDENREIMRGAFNLTEPLPYVGVDAGMLSGRISIAEWTDGQEPILLVEKRGRFITNMDFADFVTAAVDTDDERIASSCMVILEKNDPGLFDRGAPTKKLVHQLSSTRDPIFSLKIPASRIIGGYSIENGKIVPRFTHNEVIDAVFRRTRVGVAVLTAAKLVSAVEPVIRYQRGRFRGAKGGAPGTPRFDLGLQQKEDALHRLLDVWATGEAASSLVFAAARMFDELDPLEQRKIELFAAQGIKGGRAELRALRKLEEQALEFIKQEELPPEKRDAAKWEKLKADELVQFMQLDSLTNVLCPASKLWNTGWGATMMREAVSLMGGYGITEDCPGFLGQKWMDAQLEATYEGPEAVQRRQMSITMVNPLFLARFEQWIEEMRKIAFDRPGTGACTLATAMELWLRSLEHLQKAKDADGSALYHGQRQGVSFSMADALCWLLASRYLILDVLELERKGPENPVTAEGLTGLVKFMTDLCHVQAARASGEAGRVCAELVFGYLRHPAWGGQVEGCCAGRKAGPCPNACDLAWFSELRSKLDVCLTGSRLAKDRAAKALAHVMIPEALDYPQ